MDEIGDSNDNRIAMLMLNVDQLFLCLMGATVVFMQCGFAFLEAGNVRAANVTALLTKNMIELSIGFVAMYATGYALAFGPGNTVFGGSYFFLAGVKPSQYAFVFFQSTFAATSSTIVSGAIAERCNFFGHVIYSLLLTGFIYPVAVHWVWADDGWLVGSSGGSFHDLAGSAVVHVAGGTVALIATYLIGPRAHRFASSDSGGGEIEGHSVPLSTLGTFILLAGFFAFNSGSILTIVTADAGATLARATLSTAYGISGGGMLTVVYSYLRYRCIQLTSLNNGLLTGAVAVCAFCDKLDPLPSIVIGAVAAAAHFFVSAALVRFRLDDAVDAVAVHFGAGIVGTLLGPLLQSELRVPDEDSRLTIMRDPDAVMSTLLWNIIGLACIIAWNSVAAFVVIGALKAMGLLRVSDLEIENGIDQLEHGTQAYPEFVTKRELADVIGDPHVETTLMYGVCRTAGDEWREQQQLKQDGNSRCSNVWDGSRRLHANRHLSTTVAPIPPTVATFEAKGNGDDVSEATGQSTIRTRAFTVSKNVK